MELVEHQKTIRHQEILQQFAQGLQDFLLSLPQEIPFQVQCVLKQDNLMVLSQHPSGKMPESQSVFEALEQAIFIMLPGFAEDIFGGVAIPQDSEAKLYLRQLGQKQPYAFHRFNLSSEKIEPEEPPSEATELLQEDLKRLEENLDRNDSEPEDENFELDQLLELKPEADLEESSLATMLTDEGLPASDESVPEAKEIDQPQWLWWAAAGVGVSVASFIVGILFVTRPCMFGRCEPFQEAQILSEQAVITIKTARSDRDLKRAQQQLDEADQLLSKIPVWSGQHDEAKTLLENDQAKASQLVQVLTAASKAEVAIQKSQAVPYPVAEWQGVRSLWQEAIAQLESIPPESPLSSLVQNRLTAYRQNLENVDHFIASEQQAQKKLAAAKSTAGTAQARQGVANTPEKWQQVKVTWQVAVNALQEIPNTTTSFTEAQQLLADYSSKLAIASDRANREQLSQNGYQQAVHLAKNAEKSQRQSQWTQAVKHWRSALKQIQQIPEETAFYEQAQALVAPYTNSLQQAESQLREAVFQQKLRADLERVCAGPPKTCSYFVMNDMIRVQFTPAYEKALQQAMAAGQTGNYGRVGGAVNNIDTLQAAFQAISNNANMPIDVYNAAGTEVMGSFRPVG